MTLSEARGTDVAIIGAGISGLAAAHRLTSRGVSSRVLEAGDGPGGLLACIRQPGYRVARLYHHIFEHDGHALGLLQELGLADRLAWASGLTGYYREGRWFDLSRPSSLLRFKPLTFRGRLRLGLGVLRARREKDIERLDGTAVQDWLRIGEERSLRELLDAMSQGKFGLTANRVSAAFLAGRVRARTVRRSLCSRGERFGYLKGGLGLLTEALAARVAAGGGEIEVGARVETVEKEDGSFVIRTTGGRAFRSPRIVSTIPPHRFADIAAFLAPAERRALRRVRYTGVICLCCALDRSLSPYYWGMVNDPRLPFTVVVEHTRLYRGSEYGGTHLLYAARYQSLEGLSRREVEDIGAEMLQGLERLAGNGPPPAVLWHETSAYADATPVYEVGFGETVRSLPRIDGVWMTGAPFTYPDSRNINSMVRVADRAAAAVCRDLDDERSRV